MSGVLYLVASTTALLMALGLLPVAAALGSGEPGNVGAFLLTITLVAVFAAALALALRGRTRRAHRRLGAVAVMAVWLAAAVAGMIPIAVAGQLPVIDALFEAVSGVTTTSITLLPELAAIDPATAYWRAVLEWFGGFLVLACVIHVLAPAGLGGLPQIDSRHYEGATTDPIGLVDQSRPLFLRYVLATLLVFATLILMNVDGSTAYFLAIAGVATGGFVPVETPLEDVLGRSGLVVFALFLMASAMGLFWIRLRRGEGLIGLLSSRETAYVAGGATVLFLLYFVMLARLSGPLTADGFASVVAESLFASASVVSTSGLESRFGIIGLAPTMLVLFVVLSGAGVFSSSGGIKAYRIVALARLSLRELSLLIHPSGVSRARSATTFFGEASLATAWTVFALLVVTVAAGTLALNLSGVHFDAAIALAIALVSNAGPIYDALVPAGSDGALWPQPGDLSAFQKVVAMVLMLAGRMEILALIIAVGYAYWRRG